MMVPMPSQPLKYYHNLDGLRGLAAFSVLLFHFVYDKRVNSNIDDIAFIKTSAVMLQHGVTLFFVLSGFVITRILLVSKDNHDYFSRFYKRRALRIFPLYYLYLIVHFYIFPFIVSGHPNTEFNRQLPVYIYLQNMDWLTGIASNGPGHYWSLAVEEHFYLFWPLLVFIIPRDRIKATIFLLLALAIPVVMLLTSHGIDTKFNTFSRYDSIMFGCLIAVIERSSGYSLKRIDNRWIMIAITTIGSIGVAMFLFQDHFQLLKSSSMNFLISLFFALIIYSILTINERSLSNKILTHNAMQYFGRISYGLYVWHMLAISITSLFGMNSIVLNLIASVIITIFMAHLSYFHFEKIFLKLK